MDKTQNANDMEEKVRAYIVAVKLIKSDNNEWYLSKVKVILN